MNLTNLELNQERSIEIPDLYVIDRYDKIRTIAGGEYERNNISSEEEAEASGFIVFNGDGLTERDIRTIFKSSLIRIEWTVKEEVIEKPISIGDAMIYKVD